MLDFHQMISKTVNSFIFISKQQECLELWASGTAAFDSLKEPIVNSVPAHSVAQLIVIHNVSVGVAIKIFQAVQIR